MGNMKRNQGLIVWSCFEGSNVVRCVTVRGGAMSAVRCGVVRCGVVWCGAVRCGAVWCGAVRCGAV